jgi:hypothetical protein
MDIQYSAMSPSDKPLVWLHGEVRTPPFSREARLEAGYLLRRLQQGDRLVMPQSRPMPVIGEVLSKKSTATPRSVIEVCKRRFREYDDA